MNDKIIEGIGVLKYEDDCYMGKMSVNFFSRIYEICIRIDIFDAGPDGLTKELTRATQNCIQILNSETNKVMEAIFEYYNEEVKDRADDGFCDYIEMADYNELFQVMTPIELYVVNLNDSSIVEDIKAGLYFKCAWNDEGYAIRFNGNGKIVRMGTGEILY